MSKSNPLQDEIDRYAEALRTETDKMSALYGGTTPLGMTAATPDQQVFIFDYPETLYPGLARPAAAAQLRQDMGAAKYVEWVKQMAELKGT